MKIPFMNLKRQNDFLKNEYLEAFRHVIESSSFILGKEVEKFESEFAAYQQVKYCLGTSSGTTALHLALIACGIGSGDEVITVPNSFVATAEAIAYCGAIPVFVDIDPETYLLNPALIEAAITPKTRAIIPVHLYGCPAQLGPIQEIAERHRLTIIEDAAQAHGAQFDGKRVGNFSRAAAFSFYPGKNLGALGDAGAVVTNDQALYEKMLLLRNHGSPRKYIHDLVGYNYRLDSLKGATLSIKLCYLDQWTLIRQARAKLYSELLSGSGLKLPTIPRNVKHVFHVYVVETGNRDRLMEFLKDRGIETNIHYPVPIHLQKAFTYLGYRKGAFPVAEKAAERILSLPLCSEITDDEIREVVTVLKEGLRYVK